MELAGRLHPMLVHFPIALALIAAGAEALGIVTRRPAWHGLALANVRAGALFALGATAAGWLFARGAGQASDGLEIHRWLAIGSTAAMITAAILTIRLTACPKNRRLYRVFLFASALGISITAHLGGMLVWGENFLHI
jgi:uncharacterized membrane protein